MQILAQKTKNKFYKRLLAEKILRKGIFILTAASQAKEKLGLDERRRKAFYDNRKLLLLRNGTEAADIHEM